MSVWPRLTLQEWEPTFETLHRWIQIVGKTRLALSPMQNHWWQVVLYVTARGLTTSPIPYRGRTFEVEFDFIDHLLLASTNDGAMRSMPLRPQSVADFYRAYLSMMHSLDIEPNIRPVPSEIPDSTPFTADNAHASYDADAAHRCWLILAQSDRVLKRFRGRFLGKSSPVHFWWGGFDIACTRFSGRGAPVHPGGIPTIPDYVTREGYSHECISAGWWPGMPGGPVTEPAYYAYAYPEPDGCAVAQIRPADGYYHEEMHEWILPYESVRSAQDPDGTLLDFFQSTYEAAADLGKWDRIALERPVAWRPPPSVHVPG